MGHGTPKWKWLWKVVASVIPKRDFDLHDGFYERQCLRQLACLKMYRAFVSKHDYTRALAKGWAQKRLP